MSAVWIVSMVLAWVVIALLAVCVLSLLRQLGEVRRELAEAPGLPSLSSGAQLYDPVQPTLLPVLHDGGLPVGAHVAIGDEGQRQPVLLVVHGPGCESCEGIEDTLQTLAGERPGALLVSVIALGEPWATEHAEAHPLVGVPAVAFEALPRALRPDTTPAIIALTRDGIVAALGAPGTLEGMREAAAVADGAVLAAGPDSIRVTDWGHAVPAWGVSDSLDVVHVTPTDAPEGSVP